MILILLLISSVFASGVALRKKNCSLLHVETVDCNGFSQTISDIKRLRSFDTKNFTKTSSYKKVKKTYKRDKKGSIRSFISIYYDSGQIKQMLETKDNRACGKYFEWYESGKLKIDASVVGGIADVSPQAERSWIFNGRCFALHENGNVECEISYLNGSRVGETKTYFPSGNIKQLQHYKDNKLDGICSDFDDNQDIISTSKYFNGKRDGISKLFYKNKIIALEDFKDGLLINGTYTNYEGKVLSSIRGGNGTRLEMKNGRITEKQNYVNGNQKGKIEFLNEEGFVYRIANFEDGMLHGDDYEFFISDKRKNKSFVSWNRGIMDGFVKTWYKNGQLQSSHQRSKNVRDGAMTCYYPNGQIMITEDYKDGLLVSGKYFAKESSKHISKVENGNGIATIFNSDGTTKHKIIYKNGKPFIKE